MGASVPRQGARNGLSASAGLLSRFNSRRRRVLVEINAEGTLWHLDRRGAARNLIERAKRVWVVETSEAGKIARRYPASDACAQPVDLKLDVIAQEAKQSAERRLGVDEIADLRVDWPLRAAAPEPGHQRALSRCRRRGTNRSRG